MNIRFDTIPSRYLTGRCPAGCACPVCFDPLTDVDGLLREAKCSNRLDGDGNPTKPANQIEGTRP